MIIAILLYLIIGMVITAELVFAGKHTTSLWEDLVVGAIIIVLWPFAVVSIVWTLMKK